MEEANSMAHHQALQQQHQQPQQQQPQQQQHQPQQQHLHHQQLLQQQLFLMQQKQHQHQQQQQQLQQHQQHHQQQQQLQQHQQQQHHQQQHQQQHHLQQQQQLQQHQQQQHHQQQHQQQQHLQQQQQLQQHQQQLQQQQQKLQQQPQNQHQLPHQAQQQQRQPFNPQQQAISRFPSNIDAHLRAPGFRSLHFNNAPPPSFSSTSPSPSPVQPLHRQPSPQVPPSAQQQQPQPRATGIGIGIGVGVGRAVGGNPAEVEMAEQDAFKVCNPDVKHPFTSIDDAVHRLLPYHVVSDYEAEEDDRILDSDTTGRIHSRLQQWDHNILTKIAEFTTTFEKQVLAFNIMTGKRSAGEFRSEERLMIEQALLQEEKHALLQVKADLESREKAGREAVEAKMRMAMVQAEQARAEAQSHPEMIIRPAVRAGAAASQGDAVSGHDLGQEQGSNMEEIQGWANAQRDDDETSEDFLNDDNETENGDAGTQDKWRGTAALDLNSR